jgi:hypothetical protein
MEKPERERELKPHRETETEKATSCKESVQRDKVYCIIMGDLQEAEIHKQGKTSL